MPIKTHKPVHRLVLIASVFICACRRMTATSLHATSSYPAGGQVLGSTEQAIRDAVSKAVSVEQLHLIKEVVANYQTLVKARDDEIRTMLGDKKPIEEALLELVRFIVDVIKNKNRLEIYTAPSGIKISLLSIQNELDSSMQSCNIYEQAVRLFRQAATGYVDPNYVARMMGTAGSEPLKVAHLNSVIAPVVELLNKAQINQDRVAELESKQIEFKAKESTIQTIENLKAEVARLKKIESAPNSAECARYIEYIKQLNKKMQDMQGVVDTHKQLRSDYDVLLGRYEMLRVQYVRLRTRRMTPTPLPDFVAGRSHPCDPRVKYVTNLSGLRDTEKAIRRSTAGTRPYPAHAPVDEEMSMDDEGDDGVRQLHAEASRGLSNMQGRAK